LFVQDLNITRFEESRIKAANVTGDNVRLPLSFSHLEVTGRFRVDFTCEKHAIFKKPELEHKSANGTVTQTIAAGEMAYNGKIGPALTLTGVSISGSPSVSAKVDGGVGLEDGWPPSITEAVRGAVTNVFLSADFSSAMLASLNKIMGA